MKLRSHTPAALLLMLACSPHALPSESASPPRIGSSAAPPPQEAPLVDAGIPVAPSTATAPASVEALTEKLAQHHRVESEAIGYSGEPSAVYRDFAALAAAASPDEMLALLHHASPTVRVYAAQHVVAKQSESLAAVLPLLADVTLVASQWGCTGMSTTVGSHVAIAMESAMSLQPKRSVQFARAASAVVDGSQDPSLPAAVRSSLLRAAGEFGAPGAKGAALSALGDKEADVVAGALDALFAMGATDVLQQIAPLSQHPAAAVRRSVAALLGHQPSVIAAAQLDALTHDANERVQKSAQAARLRHASNSPREVLAALAGEHGSDVSVGLTRLATPWAVEVLIEQADRSAKHAVMLSQVRFVRDAKVVAHMRDAAAKPAQDDAGKARREHAKRWLDELPKRA